MPYLPRSTYLGWQAQRRGSGRAVLVGLVMLLAVGGCDATPGHQGGSSGPAGPPERLTVDVLEVLPHNPDAFTQGLELAGRTLYEGTGQRGESAVTASLPGKPPRTKVRLPEDLFGEGITVVGDALWQLTWKAGVAIRRDRATLKSTATVHYSGEGWGLCYQAGKDRLVMSDGSATLTFRDPTTFEALDSITVRGDGAPVPQLNELECVGGQVYANVWQTNKIVRIDPATARVTASIEVPRLLSPAQREHADVLNGVAAIPNTDQFLITGKLWPKTFRVRFVPAQ